MIPSLARPAAMYALAVLPFTCASASAFVTPDLTGVWASNNTGVVYYIRQLGNTVWWAALDPDMASPVSSKSNSFHRGVISTQVFQGTMSGSTVTGDWADLPRQSNTNLSQGTLSVSVNLDARGNVTALQPQTQTGAPTGDSWVRILIPQPPCVDITGHRDMYCLFAKVLKNQTETIWGSRESLLDNLKPYKDNVVVFGTVFDSFKPFSLPSSCSDFFTNTVTDDDLDFVITADRANLDAQPGFWTDGWRNPASDVQGKLNAWQNSIHNEIVAYGRQDAQCQAGGPVFLPGYGELGANSMLSQGVPVAGGVVDVGNQVVINGSPLMKRGSRVRVTGPLVLDCGHGLSSPCHETENDPGDPGTKNLEIHPVYSLDILQDFTLLRPSSIDLTGVWAASDVGTYYVRQIGDTIWWLGLSRDQGLTLTSVFRGNLQKGIAVTGLRRGESAPARAAPPGGGGGPPPPLTTLIAGQFASLPLGGTQGDGNLTLTGEFCPNLADGSVPCNTALAATSWNVLNTQTSSSPLFTNGPNGSFAWQKLYDRNTTGAPQIAVPQTMVMGTVANGIDVNISLPVRNIGTAPLIVQSITTSARTLTVSPSTLTIPPGVTELVNVDWLVATNVASGKTEVLSGSIGLRSNDPDSPGVTVTLQVTVRGGPRQ